MQVVLIRPWTDAHAGGGCCGADVRDGVCLDRPVGAAPSREHDHSVLGETYQLLRSELPGVDVQLVSAGNTAYLLPSVVRSALRAGSRWREVLRKVNRATTAGAVLVDGEVVGDLATLGPRGVLDVVRGRAAPQEREAGSF